MQSMTISARENGLPLAISLLERVSKGGLGTALMADLGPALVRELTEWFRRSDPEIEPETLLEDPSMLEEGDARLMLRHWFRSVLGVSWRTAQRTVWLSRWESLDAWRRWLLVAVRALLDDLAPSTFDDQVRLEGLLRRESLEATRADLDWVLNWGRA
jgi:hypothetical protein